MRLYIADIGQGITSQFFLTEQEAVLFCQNYPERHWWPRMVWTWDLGETWEHAMERNVVYRHLQEGQQHVEDDYADADGEF